MKKILAPVLASAMLLGSTVAQAETRPAETRFSQPVTEESNFGENTEGTLLLIAALGAVIAGIIIAAGGGDSNSPN